jgi:molecular chaperone DnaK (HSP70)
MATKRVYGIDLGTTYSCIAYMDEHGRPVIIPNKNNQLTTPSVVFFETEDNIVVGDAAKENAILYPDQIESTVKRVMGDPTWTCHHFDKSYRPQEVSSFILRKLVEDAQANTGDTIEDVVITCPAYFGTIQKEATKQAGTIAGLNVLYVIPEPTAAAVAYGIEKEEDQVILVYDLGGGTFDITLIETKQGDITVLKTAGDHLLGGKNWDESLAMYLAEQFSEETGIEAESLFADLECQQELMGSAEKIKKALTDRESYTELVRFAGERAKIVITRETFDDITKSWLESTFSLTDELINEAKDKGFPKIDKLLLVGGSTYMPQVIEGLKERFTIEAQQFDPNLAVAKGAAIFGFKCQLDRDIIDRIKVMTGQEVENIEEVDAEKISKAQEDVAKEHGLSSERVKKLAGATIRNVTSSSFGIVCFDQHDREVVSNLILANDRVPKSASEMFVTRDQGQSGVTLRCYESRLEERTHELEQGEEIGQTEVTFARPLPQGSEIEVSFNLAEDGLLQVSARDLTTGATAYTEFQTESLMKAEELEASTRRNLAIKVSS